MYAISTSAFVSILALASSLAVIVRAGDPRPICVTTYNVVYGEGGGVTTCDSLIKKFNLSSNAQLQGMNPTITINCPDLPDGKLCVATKTPACTQRESTPEKTCKTLMSEFRLSPTRFYELNDDVNDCNNLEVGHIYCVADST